MLTDAGWSVIMLEKGRNHLLALDAPFGPLGHVSQRRDQVHPPPLPRPRSASSSRAPTAATTTTATACSSGEVNNLPSTVGGGGFHADGKLPRFREVDFQPRSELGPIDGADVVDWPVDYDEMEPYYAEAERLVGVAGDAGANPFAEWRVGPVPDAARAPTCSARSLTDRGRDAARATTRTARRPA